MGQIIHRGLLQGLELVWVVGLWVRRLVSTISLQKVTEGGFGEEVLGGWIRGEDVEAFSKDPFESV